MTPQSAFQQLTGLSLEEGLEKAIENGYLKNGEKVLVDFAGEFVNEKKKVVVLLDKEFWKCLGKGLNWDETPLAFKEPGHVPIVKWWSEWHAFLDFLAQE